MSSSSLWVMNHKLIGSEFCTFDDSWTFAPQFWDYLETKYRSSPIMFGGHEVMNNRMNASHNLPERVLWEISMQQVFYSADIPWIKKHLGSIRINDFFNMRTLEMSKALDQINPQESPYFVFKNTSVDNSVVSWFSSYNNETKEYERRSLMERSKVVVGFIRITEYNLEFHDNLEVAKALQAAEREKSTI